MTPSGRVWFAAAGEVRQVTAGGAERVLARRNEREQLIAATEAAAAAEHTARTAAESALPSPVLPTPHASRPSARCAKPSATTPARWSSSATRRG